MFFCIGLVVFQYYGIVCMGLVQCFGQLWQFGYDCVLYVEQCSFCFQCQVGIVGYVVQQIQLVFDQLFMLQVVLCVIDGFVGDILCECVLVCIEVIECIGEGFVFQWFEVVVYMVEGGIDFFLVFCVVGGCVIIIGQIQG